MITKLRKRMIKDMQLRGMSKKMQESYVRSVRKLAEHYHKPPDKITEEDLRGYFLFLSNVKKYARATVTIALCGIKFFYNYTAQRNWPSVKLLRPKREKRLPVILGIEEVRRILSHIVLIRHFIAISVRQIHGETYSNCQIAKNISARDCFIPSLAPVVLESCRQPGNTLLDSISK